MRALLARCLLRLRSAFGDEAGGIGIVGGVAMVTLAAAAGTAFDYARMSNSRSALQNAADSAALAAAREYRLGNVSQLTLVEVATASARDALGAQAEGVRIAASADLDKKTVTVLLSRPVSTVVMQYVTEGQPAVSAKATARVTSGAPICVIGLDPQVAFTVGLEKNARLEAPGCAVYSNSTTPAGLMAMNNATVKAAFICSAGGKSSPGPGSFLPTPQTDCPVLPDPLQSRPQPTVGACTFSNTFISTNATLTPGVYCGGIRIAGGTVSMQPGVYILKNGPLAVGGGGSLSGVNVGIFLTGTNARLQFDVDSTISLTAPKQDEMAGMLVFEDRAATPGQIHEIKSDNARQLLGTIYLPRGRLHVAANRPVASESAYTIVVARQFSLSEGPTMVLNTNYSATTIPVPAGVGPNGTGPKLTQ